MDIFSATGFSRSSLHNRFYVKTCLASVLLQNTATYLGPMKFNWGVPKNVSLEGPLICFHFISSWKKFMDSYHTNIFHSQTVDIIRPFLPIILNNKKQCSFCSNALFKIIMLSSVSRHFIARKVLKIELRCFGLK